MELNPIIYWVEFLVIYIFVFFLILSSVTIIVFLFNKVDKKKSFEQIYSELLFKKTIEGKTSIIKYIHSYILKHTFEELLLYNLKYNKIKFHHYYYFLGLVSAISIFLFFIVFPYISNPQAKSFFFMLIFLIPFLFIFIPIIVLRLNNNRTTRIEKTSWVKICSRLYVNFAEIFFIIYASLGFLFFFFFVLESIFITPCEKQLINFMQIDYFTSEINLLISYFSNFEMKNIKNQLSLAGFYFSLAVGGTVVLSITDRYFKEEETLKSKLSEQVEQFKELYSKPGFSLSLNLLDIVSFDPEYIKNFENNFSEVQKLLECDETSDKRIKIDRYRTFIFLIVFTYVIGIVTIFMPERFEIYSLSLFITISVVFGVEIYKIYQGYRR